MTTIQNFAGKIELCSVKVTLALSPSACYKQHWGFKGWAQMGGRREMRKKEMKTRIIQRLESCVCVLRSRMITERCVKRMESTWTWGRQWWTWQRKNMVRMAISLSSREEIEQARDTLHSAFNRMEVLADDE